jgi:hypothetical protein
VCVLEAGEDDPPSGLISRLKFSADGRSLLLVVDGEARIWEVAGGRERVRLPEPSARRQSVAWSPDGRLVALCGWDDSVRVLTTTGKKAVQFEGKQGTVQSLAFSPDGRLLASGGFNGTIVLWDIQPNSAPQTTLSEARRGALWGDLIDADAGRAYRAVLDLADAPATAVALIRERLGPLPAPPDRKHLEEWIALLDSDEFARREKASRELAEAGPVAEDLLRQALEKDPSPEMRRRVRELLKRIAANGMAPVRLRAVRAVEVLERIGTPAAKALLADLARRLNDPLLQQEIKETLDRLGPRR